MKIKKTSKILLIIVLSILLFSGCKDKDSEISEINSDEIPEASLYSFIDGKDWNNWEMMDIFNLSDFGQFGNFEHEAQIATNDNDGIKMTRIFVGAHNFDYNFEDDYPHRANCLMIGVAVPEDKKTENVAKTIFGDRIGAITYILEYPIIAWQLGNENPLLDILLISGEDEEERQNNQSYFPPSATVLLHSEPLDYTQPFENQGMVAAIAGRPGGIRYLEGFCSAEDNYHYITIVGADENQTGWGEDYVQIAFISLTVDLKK